MLLKKYNIPLNIFICFEKLNVSIFTSNVLYKNNYVFFINKNNYYNVNYFIKHELFLNYLNLTELSVIDTLKYNKINNKILNFKNNRLIQFNIFNCYFSKIKIVLLINIKNKLDSIDELFLNSNWLEREANEMFNINYTNKKDDRSLLLDYSRIEFPMLKDFPCEGFQEIYFDFFENKLNYIKSEIIEL